MSEDKEEMKEDLKIMMAEVGFVDRLVQRIEALEKYIQDQILHPEIFGHAQILQLWNGLNRKEYECDNFKNCPLPGRPKFLEWNDKHYDYNPEIHGPQRQLTLLLDRFGPPHGYGYICADTNMWGYRDRKNGNKVFGIKECIEHSCSHSEWNKVNTTLLTQCQMIHWGSLQKNETQ